MAEPKRAYMTCPICGQVHRVLTKEEIETMPPWEVERAKFCHRCKSGFRRFRPPLPGDDWTGCEAAVLVYPS